MEAKASHYGAPCAPRKARLLRGLLIGKSVADAVALLKVERRAGSVEMYKLIKSAMAQLSVTSPADAKVIALNVDMGPKRRTFMPRARGSASPIEHKTCHMKVVLSTVN